MHMKDYLAVGKSVSFLVRGGSMSPFLKDGDKVLLAPYRETDLRVGRIILASVSGVYFLHRIIKVDKDIIHLAGDANLVQVETVYRQDIVGQVYKAYRKERELYIHSDVMIFCARIWFYSRSLRWIVRQFTTWLFKRKEL